jgi:hypothetical protein
MERDEKEKIGVEKVKWNNRVSVRTKWEKMKKMKSKIRNLRNYTKNKSKIKIKR